MSKHPTSIISPKAKIADSATIGPYCIIEGEAEIEENVQLISHVSIAGKVQIKKNTTVYPFTTIGFAPQDLKYKGEESIVIIGENNTIREHCTIHRGTKEGGMRTIVEDNCLLMVGSHVAHDCHIKNNVIMANNTTIGGHVILEQHSIIGGLSAIHQHVRIGQYAMIGGFSAVADDVMPFGFVHGERATLKGVNITGMRRNGFKREQITDTQQIFEYIFGKNSPNTNFNAKLQNISNSYPNSSIAQDIYKFLSTQSKRAICMPSWYFNNNTKDNIKDNSTDKQ